jgi:hypothetical protein
LPRAPVETKPLFALALAVGLTPQLLPAIISINLSHGARRMAERKVIVKRLTAIENFGSMNVLNVVAAEVAKHLFYRRARNSLGRPNRYE